MNAPVPHLTTALLGSYAAVLSAIFHIPTNPDAPVKASRSIYIHASPEKVWTVLTTIDAWDSWQTDIRQPHLQGALQPGATFSWITGGTRIRSTLHTVEPARRFGWTGKAFGLYAVHNWQLNAVSDGGTEVQVDETMQGMLARVLKASLNRSLASGMQHWLQLLKSEAEKQ